MNKTIICIATLLVHSATFSQQSEFSKYVKQPIELTFEKNCHGRAKIKRTNTNSVTLMFFQNKSDSISIYVNGNKVTENYLKHDSDLVSTDYTGFDFSKQYLEKKNVIIIIYRRSSSYIEFELDKKFSLYSIHFYDPGKCYVSGRKCQLNIK
jgi:hypothetical protein